MKGKPDIFVCCSRAPDCFCILGGFIRVQILNEGPKISSSLLNVRLGGECLTGWKVRLFYAHCPEREEEELVSLSLSLYLLEKESFFGVVANLSGSIVSNWANEDTNTIKIHDREKNKSTFVINCVHLLPKKPP